MKLTKNIAAVALLVLLLSMGIVFMVQDAEGAIWNDYFNFAKWYIGVFFSVKLLGDTVKSVWYRPELDPNNTKAPDKEANEEVC